jgi:uncharacterized protein YbaR (Trm112 family)
MNPKYLDILACPACKGRLSYDSKVQQLICTVEKTAYPIIDGIMMLERNYAIDLTVQTPKLEYPHEK